MSKDKILALILARGGSKRIPGKNKRLLNGKPLISWSIEAFIKVKSKNILLSTDDKECKIAKSYDVMAPSCVQNIYLPTNHHLLVRVFMHSNGMKKIME